MADNPKLTPKQEKFASCIADGMSQADAYRAAFDAENMKDSSIHVNASKLMAGAKVAQRVQELRNNLATKALWTREMSVKALVSAYKLAKDVNSATGMTGAIKELNAMHGFNEPTKHDMTARVIALNSLDERL
jgi:phage terminase small subunit